MNNKTIIGVPRELLMALLAEPRPDASHCVLSARAELMTLLAAPDPIVEADGIGEPVPVVGKLVPHGGGYLCWHPGANQGQAVVLQTNHVEFVAAMQSTIAQLKAENERLRDARGEVERYDRYYHGAWFEVAAGDVERFEKDGWKIRRLYSETYAKVNLPERRTTEFLSENRNENIGWNACLDEVRRMNP